MSLGLLARVHRATEDVKNELNCRCRIATIHPYVPDFWIKIGEAYSKMGPSDKITLGHPTRTVTAKQLVNWFLIAGEEYYPQIIGFCYIRAILLLKLVENSVKDFVKVRNSKLQGDLKDRLKELKLIPEVQDRVQLFASMDLYRLIKFG